MTVAQSLDRFEAAQLDPWWPLNNAVKEEKLFGLACKSSMAFPCTPGRSGHRAWESEVSNVST
jgi:hypothetical protein